jgi:hypothetical protein
LKPKIILENEVWRKVMYWVNKSQYEVSGLGIVKTEANGVFRVVDTMLLPQKNGSTHTDIEPEDVNRALFALRDSDGDLKWWWHSHVNMSVFWSGTDMDTIKKLGQGGWFANTVFNKKRETRSALYANGENSPWQSPLFLDELATEVAEFRDEKTTEWDAEYDKNVDNKKWSSVVPYDWQRNSISGLYTPGESGTHRFTRTGGNGTTTATDFNPKEEPPVNRPIGMPKRTYKAWKRAWKASLDLGTDYLDMGNQQARPIHSPVTTPPSEDTLDDYGFSQDERTLLAQEGWSVTDVDCLLEENVTPSEMIEMAELGLTPQEVTYMLNQHYTPEMILHMAERFHDATPVENNDPEEAIQ